MSEVPIELGFASTHEWAKQDEEGLIVVGISDHAQDALGDIVYVEMPEVGQQILAGEEAVRPAEHHLIHRGEDGSDRIEGRVRRR